MYKYCYMIRLRSLKRIKVFKKVYLLLAMYATIQSMYVDFVL